MSKGLPVLSDLGEARIGTVKQKGDIMPGIYRAPEVILDMEWDTKVDIWAMGVMVSQISLTYPNDCPRANESRPGTWWKVVICFFAKKDRILNDEQHLAGDGIGHGLFANGVHTKKRKGPVVLGH